MNWLTCWDLDLWVSNGGSPCITKLTTYFFLKTKEITGTPHVPQFFRCVKLIQQSPLVDCDMWLWDQWIIVGLCSVFVVPPVSQLVPPQLSSLALPRNPSCKELSQTGFQQKQLCCSSSLQPHQSIQRTYQDTARQVQWPMTDGFQANLEPN